MPLNCETLHVERGKGNGLTFPIIILLRLGEKKRKKRKKGVKIAYILFQPSLSQPATISHQVSHVAVSYDDDGIKTTPETYFILLLAFFLFFLALSLVSGPALQIQSQFSHTKSLFHSLACLPAGIISLSAYGKKGRKEANFRSRLTQSHTLTQRHTHTLAKYDCIGAPCF